MKLGGTDVHIIVSGYPGKSVCHGGLGWSTIALIRSDERCALIDVGTFGQRPLLRRALQDLGLTTGDITDLLLTHAHHDHIINWVMFPKARISIGASVVPELYVERLKDWPTLRRVHAGEEVFPGVRARMAPGHTPGGLIYVLTHDVHDVIFTGDSAKNRAELLARAADASLDPDASRNSIEHIWALWRARPGNIVVPGHDLPMVLERGVPVYLGQRRAGIQAWFGDVLEQTIVFDLTVGDSLPR
jgi:glyoxylase-like metal-dependent hydrolase (beta-lactamase superfamily II)